MPGALNGIRVIELSRHAAAPFCGKILACCGAEVIKVEAPGVGSAIRHVPPYAQDEVDLERGLLHLFLDTGKQSATLDIATSTGRALLLDLLRDADIVIEDLGPAVTDELDLGYEALSAVNDQLIVGSISFYGQTGPYRDYAASELTGFAMSGFMSITGLPERAPLKAGGNLGQYQGGLHAANGLIAALLQRSRTHRGQLVDASITEALCYSASMMGPWLNSGDLFRRAGSRHNTSNAHHNYPTNVLPCKDGWVHLHYPASGNDLIAMLLEEPRLLEEPFLTEPRGHADEFDVLCLPWLAQHDKFEIVALAQELRLPFTEVLNPLELLDDPQNRERGYFVDVEQPGVGTVRQVGAPLVASATPWQVGAAPRLGEHNERVFGELLGLTQSEILALSAAGVV